MINIARYTIEINGALSDQLNSFMNDNNINLKSVAIKRCIELATNKDISDKSLLLELDRKLNRILYRQNLYQKMLEQFFANMGFGKNEDVSNDECLKQVYQEYREKYFRKGVSDE